MNDEYRWLRFLDPRLAEAIARGTPDEQRLFALGCAAHALAEARSPAGRLAARLLRDLIADGRVHDERERRFYREMLHEVEAEAKNAIAGDNDREGSALWHALRAERFALSADELSAAALAAFEAGLVLGDVAPLRALATLVFGAGGAPH